METTKDWFISWFDTAYYHILYKDRDDTEAQLFMQHITSFLKLSKRTHILDLDRNANFQLTLSGNITLANPANLTAGTTGSIFVIQDGTGSRTLSLGTDYETAAGAGLTISTTANAVDVIPYFVKASGSIQLGAPQLAFA